MIFVCNHKLCDQRQNFQKQVHKVIKGGDTAKNEKDIDE